MSKTIFDSPAILDETLISLSDACTKFPRRLARATVERYVRGGVRGVILESVFVGGRRMTSVEAVTRFILAQLHTEAERLEPRKGYMSKKELDAESRRFELSAQSESDQSPN